MTVPQDSETALIIPVVHDVLQDIGIARRHGLKHVRAEVFEPGCYARVGNRELLLRHRDELRNVEQHAVQIRIAL